MLVVTNNMIYHQLYLSSPGLDNLDIQSAILATMTLKYSKAHPNQMVQFIISIDYSFRNSTVTEILDTTHVI